MNSPTKKFAISQTPYRISLGGGGTDLPFYFKERGGWLISATINQYVKVSAAFRALDDKILVQTTDTQFADDIEELNNAIIREALRYFGFLTGIQVATFSTIPTGIGLGTSSTLIVGLVNALSILARKCLCPMEIAAIAHHLEREILALPGGIQDQYIAALGGIQILKVSTSGEVRTEPLVVEEKYRSKLENGLVLVFLGEERDSGKIVQSQQVDLRKTLDIYDKVKEIGKRSVELLKNGDIEGLGLVMDEHWELKKGLSAKMTNSQYEKVYVQLKSLGSPGGKIIGAGGGGFFMGHHGNKRLHCP